MATGPAKSEKPRQIRCRFSATRVKGSFPQGSFPQGSFQFNDPVKDPVKDSVKSSQCRVLMNNSYNICYHVVNIMDDFLSFD